MQKTNKIYRNVQEMQTSGRNISGIAVVVDVWSKDLGGFKEKIDRSALTTELIMKSDVMLNIDHDPSKVLARSKYGKGSLKLQITDRGLEFSTEAPNTTLGNDLLEMIKRGDYSQCSFCFSIPADAESDYWYNDESGQLCREIKRFDRLYDVSVVYDPAYDQTAVDARSANIVNVFAKLAELDNEIDSIFKYD